MPIFARIRMTWTHGALWAYDADREEIRYRGWLNLLIYHPSRHRAAAPLPFRIPL
ncbi:potassium transporter [Sesbania bispinosa]|nr:potassium transporter [Sesbania bispinosa]